MITQRIRLIFTTSLLAAALSACGAGNVDVADTAIQTAAVSPGAGQSATQTASHAVDLSVDPAAVGQTPAPDCAAENCAGLRIIDGNAEAFRLDAMRRAAQENGA